MANGMETSGEGAPLLELANAYQSLRDSGFDLPTAVGELVDNSIQAEAKNVDIVIDTEEDHNVIDQVSVIDDGEGMTREILQHSLRLGYSTRYGDRRGIGRFGVGATLAGISQCKRIELYSRTNSKDRFLYTWIDLDEIAGKTQDSVPPPVESNLPGDLDETHPDAMTVVVWRKCDRLARDPNGRHLSFGKQIDGLKRWLSRAYRYYLLDGLTITVGGEKLLPHDPLFMHPEAAGFPDDAPAEVRFDHSFDWPVPNRDGESSKVRLMLSLLPKELRKEKLKGASGANKERRIADKEQQGVSVLRHNREVACGNMHPMVPAEREIDRWWGCEIHFEPDLDECWEVKNVKRGARPIPELREKIQKILRPKIEELVREVQRDWSEQSAEEADKEGIHAEPEKIVERAEKRAKPAVLAGDTLTDEDRDTRENQITSDPELPVDERERLAQKLKSALPITIRTKALVGAEFIQTDHLGNSKMVVTFNADHPFFREVYSKLEELERATEDSENELARQIRHAVDLLLMAYGRAESMLDLSNPIIDDAITELRTYWGVNLRKYVLGLTRESS